MRAPAQSIDDLIALLPPSLVVEADTKAAARRAREWGRVWRKRQRPPKAGYWLLWWVDDLRPPYPTRLVITDEARTAQVTVVPKEDLNKPLWFVVVVNGAVLAAFAVIVVAAAGISNLMDWSLAWLPGWFQSMWDTVTGLCVLAFVTSHMRVLAGVSAGVRNRGGRGSWVVNSLEADPHVPGTGRRLLGDLTAFALEHDLVITATTIGDARAWLYRKAGLSCSMYDVMLRPRLRVWRQQPVWIVHTPNLAVRPPVRWIRRLVRVVLWVLFLSTVLPILLELGLAFWVAPDWWDVLQELPPAAVFGWALWGEYRFGWVRPRREL